MRYTQEYQELMHDLHSATCNYDDAKNTFQRINEGCNEILRREEQVKECIELLQTGLKGESMQKINLELEAVTQDLHRNVEMKQKDEESKMLKAKRELDAIEELLAKCQMYEEENDGEVI